MIKEIKTSVGLGDLKFGLDRKQVKEMLGEPTEIEKYSYTESEEDLTESWHYDELDLSLGFDEDVDWRLMTIAVSSEDYLLKGKKIIGINYDTLLKLTEKMGINDLETEECPNDDGKECLFAISEDSSISFWVEDDIVTEVQWGPDYIDEDTIRWPE
jgi:hypothetical protein